MHIAQSLLALGVLFGQIASGLPAGGSSISTTKNANTGIQWSQVESAVKKGNGKLAKIPLAPFKLAEVTPKEALKAFKLVDQMNGPFKKETMLYLRENLPLDRILPESIAIREGDAPSLAKAFEAYIGHTTARSLALTEPVLNPSSAEEAEYLFLYLLDIEDHANFATLYRAIEAKKQGWSPAQQEKILETVRKAAEKKGDSKALSILSGPKEKPEVARVEETLEKAAVVEETAPPTSWYKSIRNRLPSWPFSSASVAAAAKHVIADSKGVHPAELVEGWVHVLPNNVHGPPV